MGHREGGDHQEQRAQAPQWNHEAKQEQQVIGAVENMEKAQLDEAERGLVPARVERHHPGIAGEFVGAHCSARGKESKHGDDARGKPLEPGPDGETGAIGLNRVFEQHVKQQLIPDDVGTAGELGPGDVIERGVEGREGAVGLQRELSGRDPRIRQARVAFLDCDEVGDPHLGCVRELGGELLDVQVAIGAFGKFQVADGFQRHADEQLQALAGGLDEHLDGGVGRYVVSRNGTAVI